jgi:excisionase family DNA binding protein
MKIEATFTVPETARRLGCTTKYVYDLLYSGLIRATKRDGRWEIPVKAVDDRLARREAK